MLGTRTKRGGRTGPLVFSVRGSNGTLEPKLRVSRSGYSFRSTAFDALCLEPYEDVPREVAFGLPAEVDARDPKPLYLPRFHLEPPS